MGRPIWILDDWNGIPLCVGPMKVQSFKQFLPAGKFRRQTFEGRVEVSERKKSLIQIWTDHGMRTAAVASIWSKDPGKSASPW